MTVTAKILALTERHPQLSSRAIAERLGCHHAYVRTAWHRAGIFRRKHDPAVVYDPIGKMTIIVQRALAEQRDRLVEFAEQNARFHEAQIGTAKQARVIPEPQLSQFKAQHWRILAKAIKESCNPIDPSLSNGERGV
jgi:hypothetical protein